MRRRLVVAAAALLAVMLSAAHADERHQFTFGWPFEPGDSMRPRGGTTTGTHVDLLEGPSAAWSALQAPGLSKFERDRRAILAMAGDYRTSFDFVETVGFTRDFEPARPYQSWATERIYVIEDRGAEISLQHIIVMFFVDADGVTQGPIVQKHWRQVWQYEDVSLHEFVGHGRWRERTLDPEAVRGRWSQTVYNVDDSPRYEALGDWVHDGNYSSWTSDETWRPVPRRESSVRGDYDVLIGTNRHTITPTGWVQEEDNLKVALDPDGEPRADQPYLAREVGVNRYELIVDFDFSAGDRYWETTQPFWSDVRAAWDAVYAERPTFRLAERVRGRALFEPMFDYAARVEAAGAYDAADGREFIRRTLDRYVD